MSRSTPIMKNVSKTKSTFKCTACGAVHPQWVGRCTKCQAWGTVEEAQAPAAVSVGLKSTMKAATVARPAQRVNDIKVDKARHTSTGISELDRVLGGGYVAGQVILLAGEPGVGKSTLLLDLADKAAKTGRTVLYASGEESAEQIKLRADRTGANADTLFVASETDLSVVLGHIDEVQPDLVIVDSVQTIASPDVDGRTGGVTQVMEVASVLTRVAKSRGIPMVIVCQMTKANEMAGPRQLEHLCDAALALEGDKLTSLRFLRAVKNRFASVDEMGCFMHAESGLQEVPDPSGMFLGDRNEPVAGTCVTVVMEGRRPIVAEIQSLVASTNAPNPRRSSSGLDTARIAMTQAVVERHGRIRLFDKDVYAATVGGMRILEPCADLATALAIASAASNQPLRGDLIALGEVTLSGDIRPVRDIDRRLIEAGRMGFKTALVPAKTAETLGLKQAPTGGFTAHGVRLVQVDNVSHAVAALANMQAGKRTTNHTN